MAKLFHCVNRVKDRLSKSFTRSRRRNSLKSGVRGVEVLEEPRAPGHVHGDEPCGFRGGFAPSGDHRGERAAGGRHDRLRRRRHDPGRPDVAPRDHRSRDHRRFLGPVVCRVAGRDRGFPGLAGAAVRGGADGSILRSLSLVRAGNAGVTLDASHVTVQGNYIGLRADGTTVAGNRGDGVRINASSHGDLIGQSDPVTGISYYNADAVSMQPVSGWQGIREPARAGQYLITGTSDANGLLYDRADLAAPAARATPSITRAPRPPASTVPTTSSNGGVRLVGSYKNRRTAMTSTASSSRARPPTSRRPANYRTIDYPGATYTYVHSTMGGPGGRQRRRPGRADCPSARATRSSTTSRSGTFLPEHRLPRLDEHHGLRHLVQRRHELHDLRRLQQPGGDTSTTRAGRSARATWSTTTRRPGNSPTGRRSTTPTGWSGSDFVTHFEGISSVEKGVYTLSADSVQSGVDQLRSGLVGDRPAQRRRHVRRRRLGRT